MHLDMARRSMAAVVALMGALAGLPVAVARAQLLVQEKGGVGSMRPYEAISNTAMSITGNLRLSAEQLIFARDLSYRTGPGAPIAAADAYAKGAGSWASLLNLSSGARIELRRVREEQVGKQAPNGGLCGTRKTTFIVLATSEDPAIGTSLKLAAFSGATPPGPSANAAALCGTFTYAPAAMKKLRP